MNKCYKGLFLLVFFGLGFFSGAKAQVFNEPFGKNRIQYREFDWAYYESNNFEVHYTQGGQATARETIAYLEDEFDRLTNLIGYAPYTKTKIFIYNSRADLLQSNVGIERNNYTIGGKTEFSKLLVEVPFTGDWYSYKRELVFQLSKSYITDMLFGGSIADMFQSSLINSFPDWFIDGAARYIASGWSVEMDDYVREYVTTEKNIKLTNLQGKRAELIGQSLWNYIVEKYGRRNISNVLNLSRIIRNEENSVSKTLGISFRKFMVEWQGFYTNQQAIIADNYIQPDEESEIFKNPKAKYFVKEVKISPDGKKLAYSINQEGKYEVIIRDLENNNEKVVFKGGYKAIYQTPDFSQPIIDWKDNLTIGVAHHEKGQATISLIPVSGRGKLNIPLTRINQVNQMEFSKNGRLAVLSAEIDGRSDIYVLNTLRGNTRRLTNDIFDNVTPQFYGDNGVIFSSNRNSDSLFARTVPKMLEMPEDFNIYHFDLDTTTQVLSKITNIMGINFDPKVIDNSSSFYYLSDQKGIINLFKHNVADTIFVQYSNFSNNIQAYDINVKENKLALILLDEDRQKIYVESLDGLSEVFTQQTARQDAIQSKFITKRIQDFRKQQQEESIANARRRAAQPDSTVGINLSQGDLIGRQSASDTTKQSGDLTKALDVRSYTFDKPKGIDFTNYTFDSTVTQQERQAGPSLLDNLRKLQTRKTTVGPLPYQTRFFTDNVVTGWTIDPLRGFGLQLETQLTDLLENHRFRAGAMAILDFRSGSDIFAEYKYLKYRVDFEARFDRKSIFRATEFAQQRYILSEVNFGVSYPISVNARFTVSPFFAQTQFYDLDPSLLTPNRPPNEPASEARVNYAGASTAFVYDNTVVTGLYAQQGFKGKISYNHYGSLSGSDKGFRNISVDLRNYQKIHREIVLASRLKYGRFFGANPQNYLLGGMNNWLFNDFRQEPIESDSPLANVTQKDASNILFVEFEDLRGYDYNELRGSNVLTFSTELRIPVFRYFERGSIASNFVRNFELVGFYDIGSAWTNRSPFEEENNLNTEVIKNPGSPFQGIINNFNNPWLQSYGGGLRTVLLGYYMKMDVAWPVRNYQVEEPRFYLTLGYNF